MAKKVEFGKFLILEVDILIWHTCSRDPAFATGAESPSKGMGIT